MRYGFSSRATIGIIIGWIVAFVGFFALSISNSVVVEGIGGIMGSTFFLAALQLTTIGIILSIVWVLKGIMPRLEQPMIRKLVSISIYLVMGLLAIEGLVMVYLAGDVNLTGFGGVSKKYIVLIGALLFALGTLSLRQWRLRNVPSVNWLVDTLGSLAATMLMVEGLTVVGIANTMNLQGTGGILGSTVFNAGAQLFVLGALMFMLWTIIQDPYLAPRVSKYLTRRWSLVIMVVLGGMVALEGIIASTIAGTVVIDDIGGAFKHYIVAGCAQLFALGFIAPLLWKVREIRLGWKFMPEFTSMLAMVILAFEGVFAMGLAADTYIDGIGGILESTFRLAGIQQLVLSSIGLMAWLVKGSPLLGKWPKKIVTSLPIMVLSIAALEGLAVVVMAANITIDEFSGVGEKYVLLGGAQMVILSSLALFFWARSEGLSVRFKMTSTVAAAFVLLMLPIALVL